jgi:uncharacterized membrane protein
VSLPLATSVPLLVVEALAAAIWIGGLVAIFIVARTASATLAPEQKIAFFRSLGRTYGIVGSVALLLAIAAGAVLLDHHPWDAALIATAIVAAVLILALAAGMAQARSMTRLRRRAIGTPKLADQVRRGATLAAALRAAIGLLTLTLVILGAILID